MEGPVAAVPMLLALALGACGRRAPTAETERGDAGRGGGRGSGQEQRCAAQRTWLASLAEGPPPGVPSEAVLEGRTFGEAEYGTRPIPPEDADLARAAIAVPTSEPLVGPRVYVRLAHRADRRAALEELRAAYPELEIRVLFAKPADERLTQFLSAVPGTPAHLRERLLLVDGFSTGA